MAADRIYNPLNEGYSGGNGQTTPLTIKPLQSAIIKPSQTTPSAQNGNKN